MAELSQRTIRSFTAEFRSMDPHFAWMMQGWTHAVNGDAAPEGQQPPLPLRHRSQMDSATSTAFENVVQRLWARGKTVHDVDATLWDELGHEFRSTKVPRSLLQFLPYPDPFIGFPTPPQFRLPDDGRIVVMKGMFVTGMREVEPGWINSQTAKAIPCSTHDPRGSGDAWLMIACEVHETDGRPHYVQVDGRRHPELMFQRSRLTLTGSGNVVTVGELIDQIAARYQSWAYLTDRDSTEEIIAQVVAPAISLLVYLCAKNADLRPIPTALTGKAKKSTGKQRPAKVVQVGYNVGAKLRAYHQREKSNHGTGTGPARRPHIRRGHSQTYWVGKGRQIPEIKWVAPTEVNMKGDAGGSTVVTVD
jgi:hypothetical protein